MPRTQQATGCSAQALAGVRTPLRPPIRCTQGLRLRHTGGHMKWPQFARRWWFWLLALPFALAAALASALLSAALQVDPAVALQPELAAADVERALRLLRAHDPRRAWPGRVQVLSMNARELELVLNHGGRRWATGAARVSLMQGSAAVALSLHTERWLPPWVNRVLPFGHWINAELRLVQTAGLPALDAVTVGRLSIPLWLAQPLALKVLDAAGLVDELPLLAEVVQRVRFTPDRLQLVYAWQNGMGERMLGALLPAADKERMLVYTQSLAALLQREDAARQMSLADLLGPMFELAQRRSAAGHDAARENRAAIVVLAMALNGRGLKAVLPAGIAPTLRPVRVLLGGRDDWPLHFIVSATLATESSGPFSYAMGLFKEVADARGGSGFSFNDMAANRAGTRFGELAAQQPDRLHAALRALTSQRPGHSLQESDFMPQAEDLPEFMAEPEFLRRFGGIGAPAYLQQMAEIERRVAALPVLRH